METAKISLKECLEAYNQIIIPDVQRDYVMGSGGEKLIKLFQAMAESKEKDTKFKFSCLVGYKDEKDNLYIYDGQQRLATLIFLCSLLDENENNKKLYNKFCFTGRDTANGWVENPQQINECNAVDFTTYSVAKLKEIFNSICLYINYQSCKPCDKLGVDFFLNNVCFDMVLVDKISDAEQFFLDINDGLDLKYYEIFKAELYHHAITILEKQDFKRFALKMENEWLKLFLKYKNYRYQNIVHTEEEMLIFYLKYCLRMMWIEEKENDKEYKESDVSWLKKEHFERIETITEAIAENLNNRNTNTLGSELTCIRYSIPRKGKHWNITDTNYIKMLDVFLRNVYKTEETNKDVVIWCYISKLSEGVQDLDLYEYLRFVKKLLNNSRDENKNAIIFFNNWGVDAKKIQYARYFAKGIPKYYLNENCIEECDKDFLSTIIVMNSIKITTNNYIDECVNKVNDTLLKEVLKKEKKKQNSSEKDTIMEYENLPFINGLVDNFLEYKEESCCLRGWATEEFLNKLKTLSLEDYQYQNILKYICENKISIENCKIENVNICWTKYTDYLDSHSGTLLVHTWLDLFTNENGIKYSDDNRDDCYNYFGALPEGWINDQNCIIQPDDNIHTNVEYPKPAFAARYTKNLFNLTKFYSNFSWISKSEKEEMYVINGKEEKELTEYLKDYNGKKWIDNNLNSEKKIYFSNKEYINKILSCKYKQFKKNKGEDITQFLKEKKDSMYLAEMDNKNFFIKIL